MFNQRGDLTPFLEHRINTGDPLQLLYHSIECPRSKQFNKTSLSTISSLRKFGRPPIIAVDVLCSKISAGFTPTFQV
ncbi:hypothetical protein CEXT_24381 [Caerostris extrusa]|uniref:Uncharacterized protein n=1 Tax=Caerostris extrusa TaxID=172846 RepID=A0AAV4RNR5_CAEEX|nr:hypothetical protein CEXT_24381 [Caerostris extrusa]